MFSGYIRSLALGIDIKCHRDQYVGLSHSLLVWSGEFLTANRFERRSMIIRFSNNKELS